MTDDSGRNPDGTFSTGNAVNLKHGIGRSVKALADGRELVGRAHDAQVAVHNEIEANGLTSPLRRNIERAQAIIDLIWCEVVASIQANDSEAFKGWVKQFGWLDGVVGRDIERLRDFEKDADNGKTLDVLLGKGEDNGG